MLSKVFDEPASLSLLRLMTNKVVFYFIVMQSKDDLCCVASFVSQLQYSWYQWKKVVRLLPLLSVGILDQKAMETENGLRIELGTPNMEG